MTDTNKARKNTPADPKQPRLSRRQRDALLQPYRDRLRLLAHDHEQLKITYADEIKFSGLMKRERDDAREALGRAERDGGAFRNANRGLLAERQDLLAKIAVHDKQVADLQARLNVAEQSARDLDAANHKLREQRHADSTATAAHLKHVEDANEMMSRKIAALERVAQGRDESAGKVGELKAENERLRDEITRIKGRTEWERRGHDDLVGELHRVVEHLAARLAIAVGTAAEVSS